MQAEDHSHFIVSLDGVTTKNDSDFLTGTEVWVPLETVKPRHQRSPKNLSDKWDEYTISDEGSGLIFKVIRVEEYPQQLMAIVMHDNKEILLPLTDQLITSIDRTKRVIEMTIPEGLLEL
jgi:16S rRNA processing protein RimM